VWFDTVQKTNVPVQVPGKSRYRTSPVLELHMYDNGVNQELGLE
jgi:hypothetical protein